MIHFNCLVLTIYSTSNQRQECFVVTIIKHHLHAFTYIPLQGPSVNVFCGLNVAIPIFQEIYIPHCYLSKKNIYPPLLFIQICECILVWGKLYIIVYNLVIAYFAPNIDRYFRQKNGSENCKFNCETCTAGLKTVIKSDYCTQTGFFGPCVTWDHHWGKGKTLQENIPILG